MKSTAASGNDSFTTEPFRVASSTFVRLLLEQHAAAVFVPLSLCAAILIALAIILSDLRYAILLLMLIFIITPGVMAFFYFQATLSRAATLSTLTHTLTFEQDFIILTTLQPENPEEEDSPMIATPRPPFQLQRPVKVSYHSKLLVVDLGKEGLLPIPYSLLPPDFPAPLDSPLAS